MADTNVYVILDGSGSMSGEKHEVVKGVNNFFQEQKDDADSKGDNVRLSLTTFDTNVMEIYINEDLEFVQDVDVSQTYLGGGTALLDAIGRTLTSAEGNFAPRNVLLIYTDGGENASREFSHEKVGKLLEDFEQNQSGQIIYLGAEFGDFHKDKAYGTLRTNTAHSHSLNTSKGNVGGTWTAASNATSYLRGASAQGYVNVSQEEDSLFSPVIASAAGIDVDAIKATDVKEPVKKPKRKVNKDIS